MSRRAAAKQEINPELASAAAVKMVDPQEAAALMERGRDLLRNGDVASAQLAFRRLAEAGKAEAALALAKNQRIDTSHATLLQYFKALASKRMERMTDLGPS